MFGVSKCECELCISVGVHVTCMCASVMSVCDLRQQYDHVPKHWDQKLLIE